MLPDKNNYQNNSLCSKLYDMLSSITASRPDKLKELEGNYVIFGKAEQMARVLKVNNRIIHYEMVGKHIKYDYDHNLVSSAEGMMRIFYSITQKESISPSQHTRYSVFKVYPEQPHHIIIAQGKGAFVSFIKYDSDLEELLVRGMKENPSIQTVKDLENLTRWVHNLRPYDGSKFYSHTDFHFSLGKVWKYIGAVCRHFSALEYALLSLHAIKSKFVCTNTEIWKRISRSHMFLEVPFKINNQEVPFVVDPTSNFVTAKENLIKILRKRKLETLLYQDYEEMKMYPWYSP